MYIQHFWVVRLEMLGLKNRNPRYTLLQSVAWFVQQVYLLGVVNLKLRLISIKMKFDCVSEGL